MGQCRSGTTDTRKSARTAHIKEESRLDAEGGAALTAVRNWQAYEWENKWCKEKKQGGEESTARGKKEKCRVLPLSRERALCARISNAKTREKRYMRVRVCRIKFEREK